MSLCPLRASFNRMVRSFMGCGLTQHLAQPETPLYPKLALASPVPDPTGAWQACPNGRNLLEIKVTRRAADRGGTAARVPASPKKATGTDIQRPTGS